MSAWVTASLAWIKTGQVVNKTNSKQSSNTGHYVECPGQRAFGPALRQPCREQLMDHVPSSPLEEEAVELLSSHGLAPLQEDWPGIRSRWIVPPTEGGWSGFALGEWELERAVWTDLHHHDEFNVVVEGELHVESNGQTVIAGPGDSVRVAAGQLGRYSAPAYARMISVYGPNPGRPDESRTYESL